MKQENIEVQKVPNKLNLAIAFLEEKASREYGLTIDELRLKTIVITGGNLQLIEKKNVKI